MKISISTKYALRSLGRHSRRTTLSILGIGLGCAVCLFMIAFVRGKREMMKRAAAQSGAGHMCIAPQPWVKTRSNDYRIPHWQPLLTKLRKDKRFRVVTPRATTEALLAFGTRISGVQMRGVDPATEPLANRLVRPRTTTIGPKKNPVTINTVQGNYGELNQTGTVVVGYAIAESLRVEIGDPLMVTVAGKGGEMNSAMLRIVATVRTGSRDLDRTICHVNLKQLEHLSGRPGASQLVLLLKDPADLEASRDELQAELPQGLAALTWSELMPELAAGEKVDTVWGYLIIGVIVIVVFLGIASAQLAAVLERRREFAVLAALGANSPRLVHIMLMEGLILGAAGACVGMLLGLPATYYVATSGIDFSYMIKDQGDFVISNIMLDPIVYSDFGWWLIPLAIGIALGATVLSSLYPAWFAVKTNPAEALRVEN